MVIKKSLILVEHKYKLMKNIVFISLLMLLGCNQNKSKIEENPTNNFGIVIHGGAGTILKKNMSEEKETEYRNALSEAIKVGHDILKNGGTSQQAVEKSINILEDSPLFNSGKGAVLNSDGYAELDASFMDGKTLNAGAISGATKIKNPISAAIKVMENSPHVMLSSSGADKFAKKEGLEMVNSNYFITERRKKNLERVKGIGSNFNLDSKNLNDNEFYKSQLYGTVGCVALDKFGNLAAGTSTGGMTNKKWNRIGDAPIIGAGTYANNLTCAVSSTGWGEFFIRTVAAFDIAALMEYKNLKIKDAASLVINDKIGKLGGTGGVIAIDNKGNIAMEMNTPGMYRAHMNSEGKLVVKIYKEE